MHLTGCYVHQQSELPLYWDSRHEQPWLQIGNAHKPEKVLFWIGNFSALADCSLILHDTSSGLMKFTGQSSRQTLGILVASNCQKPFCGASRPGQPAVRHGFKWPGKKIWLQWNRWQKSYFLQWSQDFIPGSCKASVCTELFSYCQVLLDLGGEEAVSPGIVSVAEPRSREFISNKPLLLLIFKGNLRSFLA